MRLLLDAHVSGRRIGPALRDRGHDVLAVDDDRSLDRCPDEELLRLAAADDRILVTFNAGDFARLANSWAEAGRSHEGCLILVGIDHSEFGVILRRLQQVLERRPHQGDWRNLTMFLGRTD